MTERRKPDTYLPSTRDILWLISESPRGKELFCDWHGRATAEEIAAALWPIDPNVVASYPHLPSFCMNNMTPAQWVALILDRAVVDRSIHKEGNDYVVPVSARHGNDRPYLLPKWEK